MPKAKLYLEVLWGACVSASTEPKSKPRVLFIGPYPPPYAGPEAATELLIKSSFVDTFDVFHLNTNFRKSNAEKGKIDFIAVTQTALFFLRILRVLFCKKPRIVYYFVTATMRGWIFRDIWVIFLSKIFKAKIIIHMRGGHFRLNYERTIVICRWLIQVACRCVSAALVQSNSLKTQFTGILNEDRIISIYNAIDTKKYSNNDLLNYRKRSFLFLGHLSFAKGYCDILKTIPEIADEFPDAMFFFAGSIISKEKNVLINQATGNDLIFIDPNECYHHYIAGKYVSHHKYLGFLNEKQKVEMLKYCDALLLPSYSEGLPNAVLEAICMGKPVICSSVGALNDIIKDRINGLLISPGDVDALKEAIRTLCKDFSLRDSMAKINYTYARRCFSTEIIISQLTKIIIDIISER